MGLEKIKEAIPKISEGPEKYREWLYRHTRIKGRMRLESDKLAHGSNLRKTNYPG